MEKKICIITGANAGIGRQAAEQIAGKGCHVILACRNGKRGEDALREIRESVPDASVELWVVDLGLRKSIINFAEEFSREHERLDVLIHNAAVFNVTQKKRELTKEGIETIWATNHLGPVLLTELLLKKLEKSDNGRVITVSSKGLLAKPLIRVDLADPEFKSKKYSVVNAYYQSKIAQIMYTYWLADRLGDGNVTANCIRVTAVKIDISRHPGLSEFMKRVYAIKARKALSPENMAKAYAELALSSKFKRIRGMYFDENCLEVDSRKYCRDRENIQRVMELTRSYIPELGGI